MTASTEERAAFAAYLADCDANDIVPDVAGAFAWAWRKPIEAAVKQSREDASTELDDWHEQGMGHAYIEASDPGAGDEWTTEDVAKAFAAGAKLAERMSRQRQPSEVERLMDAAGLCRRCAAPLSELLRLWHRRKRDETEHRRTGERSWRSART